MLRTIKEFYSTCYELSRTNTLLFFVLSAASLFEWFYSQSLGNSYKAGALHQTFVYVIGIAHYMVTIDIVRKYNDRDSNEKTNLIKITVKTIVYLLRLSLFFVAITVLIVFLLAVIASLLTSFNYKPYIDFAIIPMTMLMLFIYYRYVYVFNNIIMSNGNAKYKDVIASSKALIIKSGKETLNVYAKFSLITVSIVSVNLITKNNMISILTTVIVYAIAGLIFFARINQIYNKTTAIFAQEA